MKRKIYAIIGALIAVTVICLSGKLFEDADKSKNYVCQMPITGEYSVWTEGGLQMQWFGDIDAYAKTSQIEFSDLEQDKTGYVAVGPNPAAGTTFNDRGKGYIIGSFRVVLPNDEQNMMEIQRDFGSEEALINNLVRPTLYKVVTACGPLMSSLESVSETRTDLTAYITDQLNNGVYKTKTSKVEAINEITGEKELRTQAELIVDENAPGGYARQEKSPFSQYGITAGIVSIIDIKYDAATQQQIDAQKAANLSVITAKTQALEAQQKAITIEEQGKARAAEAKWAQEQEKAVAVTKAEQEREVARLAAEKAEFEKKMIIAQGQAEAEANRLKVIAGLTPQERAEWDYKTAVGIAEALAQSQVSWVPSIMLTGGNTNSNNSAMDAVGLNMMLDVVKKMNEN
jgi:regulator of protease activity HflC (stomatin/prohibitin superfamily)